MRRDYSRQEENEKIWDWNRRDIKRARQDGNIKDKKRIN